MAELLQETLADKNQQEVSGESLKGKIIGVYYSAQWCPPCRAFTPALAKFHGALKAANANFEVVFVSCDQTEEQMWEYFKEEHGDYLVINYGSPLREAIMGVHGVKGIPMLVIMKDDGSVISAAGREEVKQHKDAPMEAFKTWQSQA